MITEQGDTFMLPQAGDFFSESDALYGLLGQLNDGDFERSTRFKQWTLNDVLGHLHMWNWAADLSLSDSAAFVDFLDDLMSQLQQVSLREFETRWRDGIEGLELLETWHDFAAAMSDRFARADPKRRLKWAGPDMSVRSSITARLMETWAHGQAIYDLLGVVRENRDHIKNIVILGVNTFAWTFQNRRLAVPAERPYLRLRAPSGDLWEWHDPAAEDRIEGKAEEFCQVVTQVRNIEDTALVVTGEVARQWMSIAQCFAGPPEEPPSPGTRFVEVC